MPILGELLREIEFKSPFSRMDPLEIRNVFEPSFYKSGKYYFSAGTLHFVAAENAHERNILATKATEKGLGFGYPPFTKDSTIYGAISNTDKKVIDGVVAKLPDVTDIGVVTSGQV